VRKVIALVALAAAVVGGAVFLARRAGAPEPATAPPGARAQGPRPALSQRIPAGRVEDPGARYRVPVEDSPVRGAPDALLTIVELADFECPYCKAAQAKLRQVEAAYGAKVRLVFKQNPVSAHHNAFRAALIAEEARAKGGDTKFWRVHDRLFSLPDLGGDALDGVMRGAGLEEASMKAAQVAHVDRIRRDQNLAFSLGAQATPTFFVNGRKLVGAVPLEAFRTLADEELAAAEALVRAGVAARDVYERTTEKAATSLVLVDAPPAEARN